jgi:hypothetical protein
MPLYEFACPDHKFDRFLPLARYAEPQVCECGKPAIKVLSVPMIIDDIPAYTSPIDGKLITSRRARREDLVRNNCVEYEPGFREHTERARSRSEDALDRAVDDTIEGELLKMPARKRERLEQEMRAGVSANVIRA